MKNYADILLCALMTTMPLSARSEIAEPPPDVKSWVESLDGSELKNLKLPVSLLVLEHFAEGNENTSSVKNLKFDYGLCHKESYISCVNGDSFAYGLKINKIAKSLTIDEILELTSANTVVYSNGQSIMFSALGDTHNVIVADKKKFSTKFDPQKLIRRLFQVLGYDGVVLDVREDYVLVGTLKERASRTDAQALLLKNSADHFALDPDATHQGEALLDLVSQYDGYALFKAVLSSSSAHIVRGQKIIIQSGRAKTP